jgi:hypothetical protein
LNSFAVIAVCSAEPRSAMKLGSNPGTYCASTAAVSRSGSIVMKTTCRRSPAAPNRFFASERSDNVVGQTSGH